MDAAPPIPVEPFLVAHKGGNSRNALRRALAAEVDWIEVDVWLHYGRLLARHDPTLWRLPLTYSRRAVKLHLGPALDLDRLIERTAEAGAFLLVDLKGPHPALAEQVVAALRRHEVTHRAALCGQEWGPLERAREMGDDVQVLFSLGRPEHLDRFLVRCRAGDAPSLTSCSHRILDAGRVERLRAAGARILAWTVDNENRARTLLGWGVSGITSNNYAMLARIRAEREAARSEDARSGAAAPRDA